MTDGPLSWRWIPFSLPLTPPLDTARSRLRRRSGYLVELTEDGRCGLGESTPLDGWTESLDEARKTLKEPGSPVTEDRLRVLLEGWKNRPAARHGLQEALLDLNARRSGRPLYRQLGGESPVQTIPVNGVVGDVDAATTVRRVRRLFEAGFSTVKIKVGTRSRSEERRRLEELAESQPDASLRLDANGSWSLPDVRALRPVLDALPLDYLEQPLAPGDLEAHAKLRETFPVALDESLLAATPEAILEHGAADAVVIKPMAAGGLDRAREVAMIFHRGKVTPVIGGTVDGAVARLGALHLAASLPVRAPAGLATGDRLERDLLSSPPRVREGHLAVPQSPGLGNRGVRTVGESE